MTSELPSGWVFSCLEEWAYSQPNSSKELVSNSSDSSYKIQEIWWPSFFLPIFFCFSSNWQFSWWLSPCVVHTHTDRTVSDSLPTCWAYLFFAMWIGWEILKSLRSDCFLLNNSVFKSCLSSPNFTISSQEEPSCTFNTLFRNHFS